ncbi:MAG TPA: hypothetical protein VM597_21015 [Gemmataceae bacterium]|jgi:hypothetical protein|nr:hypothetical protein [Gemmataceae bacterium]
MYALAARVAAVTVFVLAAGCGPGTGKVSGKVSYLGKPVPAGRITFRPADPRQNAVSAELDAEGNFPAVTLPTGEVTVSIDNREFEPTPPMGPSVPANIPLPPEVARKLGQKATAPAPQVDPNTTADPPPTARPRGKYLKIPEKYYDAASSGLKFEVTGGDQTKNFELTD